MHLAQSAPRPAAVVPLVPRDRLLRLRDVEALVGVKKSTIYALMKQGDFPKCIYVTARTVAWPESRVHAWLQKRIEESEKYEYAKKAPETENADIFQ